MAVKFRCTKCNRKFVDWGVNKVKSGDACDDCHGEYLEPVGYDAAQAAPRKKPALKRKRARIPVEAEGPALPTYDDDTTVAPDLDTLTSPDSGGNVDEVEEFDNTAEVETDAADEGDEEDEVEVVPAAADEEVEEVVPPVKDDEE